MATTITLKQAAAAIEAFGQTRTLFIQGEKGIGKTWLHYALQQSPAFKNHLFPAPMDTTQMSDGSLWMPDIDRENGVARELPNEALGLSKFNQRGVNGAKPVFLTFDEVGKAPRFIQNYLAPLVNERRLGGYYLPEGSVVLCLSNLAQEGLGDNMMAHFADRMVHLTVRKPSLEEWTNDFAIPHKLAPEAIAACHLYPSVFDSFLDYEPGGKYEGRDLSRDNPYITNPRLQQTKCATPRSIHAASDVVLTSAKMDSETLEASLIGAVGESFARDMMASIRCGAALPDYAQILAHPDTCPVPSDPTPQIILLFKLITQCGKQDVDAVVTYVKRMKDEMQGLFVTTVAAAPSKVVMFATNKEFGLMLAAQRNVL